LQLARDRLCGKSSAVGTNMGVSITYAEVNIRDLCEPQESISGSFSQAHSGVKLQKTVDDLINGKPHPSSLGPLEVHEGDSGDFWWCENNQRLYVLNDDMLKQILPFITRVLVN